MLIRLAYDIQFDIPATVAMVALLNVHPSRVGDLLEPDELQTEPKLEIDQLHRRLRKPLHAVRCAPGPLRLSNSTLIRDSGEPDAVTRPHARPAVGDLPNEILRFLLNSRYCEVDRFSNIAIELFGDVEPGWGRVQAICDWVHNQVTFNYQQARPTKTALDVFTRARGGLPRLPASGDHLLPRPQYPGPLRHGLPGRYWRSVRLPMDFSAWFEVYLDDRWWTFDARNNQPRMGRVLMATGRMPPTWP